MRAMFAGIAGRYDLANALLSGGCDRLWRRAMVAAVRRSLAARPAGPAAPGLVVDLATGSGDVALALRRALPAPLAVEGYDFCEPMLAQARAKQARSGLAPVPFAVGDCLALPLADGVADAATIAFGLRNLEDRARGLAEMRRILRPGTGTLVVLEFTQPDAWLRPAYYAYLRHVLPRVAGLLTGSRDAYGYLADSIAAFPAREDLAAELRAAGFSSVRFRGLTGGIVALHEAG